MTNQTRYDWIDWAKVIAIYLVVFGHVWQPFPVYVFAFHMPFFFMISGFLQKRRPFKEELSKSAKSLLAPYAIYNVYLLIYCYFMGEYDADYPLNMLLGNQWYLSMACRPLWFLLALFEIRMMHSLLSERAALVVAMICVIVATALNGSEVMRPEINYMQVWCAVLCMPFFELGALMRRRGWYECLNKVTPWLRYGILLTTLSLGMYLISLNGGIIPFRLQMGTYGILFYVNASLVSLPLFMLIYYLLNRSNNYIRLISNGTLLIFAVHQSILWPMNVMLNAHQELIPLVSLLAVVVFSAMIWLAQRYCPVLVGKWK